MSWAVTIRPEAQADLQTAYDWYEERCVGLGNEFLADHAEAILRMEANPERFPVYYRGLRRALTHRFPYKIFFQVSGHEIVILRVLHGAQDHTRKLRP